MRFGQRIGWGTFASRFCEIPPAAAGGGMQELFHGLLRKCGRGLVSQSVSPGIVVACRAVLTDSWVGRRCQISAPRCPVKIQRAG
eukprot:gene17008-biopygen23314